MNENENIGYEHIKWFPYQHLILINISQLMASLTSLARLVCLFNDLQFIALTFRR